MLEARIPHLVFCETNVPNSDETETGLYKDRKTWNCI